MQEDKKPLLDSVDEFSNSLLNMTHIIKKVRFNKEKLKNATDGNILATDIADLLSLEGIPFREAHIKVSNLTMKLKKQGKSYLTLIQMNLTKCLMSILI